LSEWKRSSSSDNLKPWRCKTAPPANVLSGDLSGIKMPITRFWKSSRGMMHHFADSRGHTCRAIEELRHIEAAIAALKNDRSRLWESCNMVNRRSNGGQMDRKSEPEKSKNRGARAPEGKRPLSVVINETVIEVGQDRRHPGNAERLAGAPRSCSGNGCPAPLRSSAGKPSGRANALCCFRSIVYILSAPDGRHPNFGSCWNYETH
jgi:hypothetical protein